MFDTCYDSVQGIPRMTLPEEKAPDNYTITCVRSEPEVLHSTENLMIVITEVDRTGEVLFTIKTSPMNWIVKRSLEDIIWLRSILKKTKIGLYVPPGIKEKFIGNKTEEMIARHQRFINKFFQAVSMSPALRESKYLQKFLEETDLIKFKKFKKQIKSIKSNTVIEELSNVNGVLHCNSAYNTAYLNDIGIYTEQATSLMKTCKNILKELAATLKTSSKLLGKLSSKLTKLIDITVTIRKYEVGIKELSEFQRLVDSWNRNTMENMKVVKEELVTHFKYGSEELIPFQEMLKEGENYHLAYSKSSKAFKYHLAKVFTSESIENWDLDPESDRKRLREKDYILTKMLHSKRKELSNEKKWHDYYNYQIINQFTWFCRFSQLRNKETFNTFTQNQQLTMARYLENLKEFEQILKNQ